MTELKASSTTLKDVIVLGPEAPEAVTFISLLQEGGHASVIRRSDPILIFFIHFWYHIKSQGCAAYLSERTGSWPACAPEFGAEQPECCQLHHSRLYGLYNINCAFAAGAAMVMLQLSPSDLARMVDATKPTAIFMGPAHASAFKGTDILWKHDFLL